MLLVFTKKAQLSQKGKLWLNDDDTIG